MLPVDKTEIYLMSGSIQDYLGMATIGRGCSGEDLAGSSPYYIAEYDPDRPLGEWIRFSHADLAYPARQPNNCEIYLMNNTDSYKAAKWDGILWVHIQAP